MRRLPLVLVLAALAGPARAADPAAILAHEEVKLDNGLRVLLLPDRRAPTISVVTWVEVGSGDEQRGHTGLAHLFEHLMFKGSPHAADGVMDKLVEEAGGSTNASTDDDMTIYTDVAAAAALERLLWLEADRLSSLHEALDEPKLDNQREVVLNERRERYENQPYGRALLLIREAVWPEGHPYHSTAIGYPEDLRSATVADARAFFATHYAPANELVVIAGDLDLPRARELVKRYLGAIPGRAPAPRAPPVPDPPPLTGTLKLTADDDVQVPRVYVTWRGVRAYTPDEAPLDLATAVLSGGKSSRLYQRLVVKERVAQDVFSGNATGRHGGVIQIVATAKPGVPPERLLAIIDEEVAALAAHPPSAAELERAQNGREARFFGALADHTTRAETLADYAARAGDADFLPRDLARYRAVTPSSLREAFVRTVRDKGRIVLTINPRVPHAP